VLVLVVGRFPVLCSGAVLPPVWWGAACGGGVGLLVDGGAVGQPVE
jgi:hypothetical protein